MWTKDTDQGLFGDDDMIWGENIFFSQVGISSGPLSPFYRIPHWNPSAEFFLLFCWRNCFLFSVCSIKYSKPYSQLAAVVFMLTTAPVHLKPHTYFVCGCLIIQKKKGDSQNWIYCQFIRTVVGLKQCLIKTRYSTFFLLVWVFKPRS